MGILDRLRAATPADFDRDLLDVLGLRPGQRFEVRDDTVTAGDETVRLEDVRAAMGLRPPGPAAASPPAPLPPGWWRARAVHSDAELDEARRALGLLPRRRVEIRDLE